MKTICNNEEFLAAINERFLSSVNANAIETFSFSLELLRGLKNDLEDLVKTMDKPGDEALRAVISANYVMLWVEEITQKPTRDVSLMFYWDCDELAFEVYNSTGQKIWYSEKDFEYCATSWMSKEVILCMISYLHSKGVVLNLKDSSACPEGYVDYKSREAINLFVYGKKETCTFPEDGLVRTFSLV